MARKPKKQTAANDRGADDAKTSNELTDDERQTLALSWLKQYEATLAAKNKAASEHSNLCKRMKGEVGDDAVDRMKDMIAARTDEGSAALRKKIERAMWAARCMAAPLGSQLELIDTEDRMPAVDRATAEGLRDGKLGITAKPDYAPGTEQFNAYMTAWHDGQKSIMDFQRAHDAAIFDDAEAAAEPSLQTDFADDGGEPATFATR
jgi:hypothetical protein